MATVAGPHSNEEGAECGDLPGSGEGAEPDGKGEGPGEGTTWTALVPRHCLAGAVGAFLGPL